MIITPHPVAPADLYKLYNPTLTLYKECPLFQHFVTKQLFCRLSHDTQSTYTSMILSMDTLNTDKTDSRWIQMSPIPSRIGRGQIMEMMNFISVSINDPSTFILNRRCEPSFCRFQLQSIDDALKFVDKFNGMKWKDGRTKMKIEMIAPPVDTITADTESLKSSDWLKMTNLPSMRKVEYPYKFLEKYIQEESGKSPKFIEIRNHLKGHHSSFAFVQMDSLDDAQKVLETLHETTWKTHTIYVERCLPFQSEDIARNEYLRGQKVVFLRNLHVKFTEEDIRKKCAYFAHKLRREHEISSDADPVESIEMICDEEGYSTGTAKVTMATYIGGAAVFDGLHGETGKSHIITTHLESLYPDTNTFGIRWIHRDVTRVDIANFVAHGVDEKPLRIEFIFRKLTEWDLDKIADSTSKEARVVLSSSDLVIQCLSKLKGKVFRDRKVVLFECAPFQEMELLQKSNWLKMYNLPQSMNERSIRRTVRGVCSLKNSNAIKSIALRHHLTDQYKMGFATLEMESHSDAVSVRENMNMLLLKERSICWVQMAFPPKDIDRNQSLCGKTVNVLLTNLPRRLDHRGINELCQQFGKVRKVFIPDGTDGYPSCKAIVSMWDEKRAKRLFDGLHGKIEQKAGYLKIQTAFYAAGFQRKVQLAQSKGGTLFQRGELKGKQFKGRKKLTKKERIKQRKQFKRNRGWKGGFKKDWWPRDSQRASDPNVFGPTDGH